MAVLPLALARMRSRSSSLERPVHFLAQLDLVQRRLRDEDVAVADQLGQLAVEEGQQQRADVMAVRVGVHQQADLVVAQLAGVEVLARAAAERRR